MSSTKDITIEDQDIALCGSVEVTKTNDDDSAPTGAEFTLYEGADTTGTWWALAPWTQLVIA